jgi:TonB dependent receptor/Carboxypeptidase regulatory-like domain/TonB-dependent Receptor Plug Domain
MRIKISVSIAVFVLLCSSVLAQNQKIGFIVGQVTEKTSGQPIVNAKVTSSNAEATTDENGNYRLELSAGEANLRVQAKGFREFLSAQITLTANRTFVQNFQLTIEISEKVEVKSDVFATTDEKPLSQTTLNRDEIRNTPGSGGDILRAVNALPSVTSLSAEFGDYIVRGGKVDENLVFIDNIPVADFTIFSDKYDNGKGGRASILAPDVIQRADFSAGGFGVRYGDKMSSVLDIALREANRKRVQGVFFIDSGGAGLSLDIPFGKRGSWLTSVRRSYIDVALDIANVGDIGRPRNWDFINKGIYDVNTKNKLTFTALNLFETFTLTPSQASGSDRRVDRLEAERRSQRAIFGLTWSSTIGNSTLSQITTWYNSQHADGGLRRLDIARTIQRTRDLRDSQIGVKEELTSSLSKKVQLAVGGGLIFDQANYASFERSGFGFSPLEEEYNRPNRTSSLNLETKTSAYAYGQMTWRPTARFAVTPAVRLDYYGLTKQTLASPRLSARFTITQKVALNFATGIYRQLPSLFTISLNSNNLNLKAQQAIHFIGGIEWLAREDLRVRAEVFQKKYDDLVVPVAPGSSIYSNAGSGYANGVEISMQKALQGRWAGQVSYSFTNSKSRLTVDGFTVSANEERPHQLTAIGITRVWGITLAGKYRLASGLPYSARTAIRIATNPNVYLQRLVNVSSTNSLRLQRYSNFDLRVEKKFDFRRWSIAPYLDLFNVFKSADKSEVNYEFNRTTPRILGERVRFPIFGLRLEF